MDTADIVTNRGDKTAIAVRPAAVATVPAMLIAVGSLIIVCVLGLHILFVQKLRETARRMECAGNLHQIGIAAHNYHDTVGTFPTESASSGAAVSIFDETRGLVPFF